MRTLILLIFCSTFFFPVRGQNKSAEFYERGSERVVVSDFEGAIAFFDRAIEADPRSVSAYRMRGRSKEYNKDFKGAPADYTVLISLIPESQESYFERSQVRYRMNDFDGSISDINTAMKRSRERGIESELHYSQRGLAYFRKKEYAKAISDFTKALSLHNNRPREPRPPPTNWFFYRGRARELTKDYTGAIEDFSSALAIEATVQSFLARSRVYRLMGKTKLAQTDDEKASDLAKKFVKLCC